MASTSPTTTSRIDATTRTTPSICGWMRTSLDANTEMPLPASSVGYSAASRVPRIRIAACACATVTPSRRRAFTLKAASSGRRVNARCGIPNAGSDAIGSQKSVTRPMLMVPR